MSVLASRPPARDVGFQIGHRESVGAADPDDGQLALLDDAAQRPRRDGQEAGRLFRRQQTGRICRPRFSHRGLPSHPVGCGVRLQKLDDAKRPRARPGAPKDERVSLGRLLGRDTQVHSGYVDRRGACR